MSRRRRRARRTRESAAGGLVRGSLAPPLAERLEGVPERRLCGLLVERFVDVGRDEPLNRRRELLQLTVDRLELARKGEVDGVEELTCRLAHRHDELRLDDV